MGAPMMNVGARDTVRSEPVAGQPLEDSPRRIPGEMEETEEANRITRDFLSPIIAIMVIHSPRWNAPP
jgi:hypothetical protein